MRIEKEKGYITNIDIPIGEVAKLRLLYSKKRKTVPEWQKELGADIVINGAFFNLDKKALPIEMYKTDGKVLSESDWCRKGFGVSEDQKTVIFGDFNKYFLDFTCGFPVLINAMKKYNYIGATGLEGLNPRTVFSQTMDGYRITLVDGRQKDKPGMTLTSLTDYLLKMGDVIHSANLDGGGSTCGVADGDVVNSPCEMRAVSNVLAIWLKKDGDGLIKEYSVKKNGNEKLSDNFKVKEFRCKDGSDSVLIDGKLVDILQSIRDYFGKPVTVNSAYRNTTYNRKIGGASGSLHVKGMAADIVVSGVAPTEVAKYAERIGVKGIGLYETKKDGYFVHVDTRPAKSFWYGQAQTYRETFGGAAMNEYVQIVDELAKHISIDDKDGLIAELEQNPNSRLYWICKKCLAKLGG